MQAVEKVTQTSATGCLELERMGLFDTSRCCELCHSADEYFPLGSRGPCRATLSDGREVFVCCASKKQLLGKTSSRSSIPG